MLGKVRVTAGDFAICALLVVLAFLWSRHLAGLVPQAVYTQYDLWFGADIPRVVANMTDVTSDHFRTKVHPLFSFLVLPVTKIVAGLPGVDGQEAVGITISLTAAVVTGLVYALARSLTGSPLLAGLATLLMLSSSSYVFWSGVPETYVFGSAAIAAVFLAALALDLPARGHVLLHVFALAFTTTNWVAALLGSLARFRLAVAVAISAAGLVVVAIGAVWQKALIPSSGVFFLPSAVAEEPAYVILPSVENLGLLFQRALNFVFAGIVAPAPRLSEAGVLQSSLEFGLVGWVGVLCWAVLLAAGLLRLFQVDQRRELLIVGGGFLAFQFLLHLVYGDEPFLYSLHFLPGLIVLAALALTGPYRRLFAVVMCLCIASSLVNNYTRLQEAASLLPTAQ